MKLKNIFLLFLSILLIFSFVGCDRGEVTEEETTEDAYSEITQPYEFELYSLENADYEEKIYSDVSVELSDEAKEIIKTYQLDTRAYVEGKNESNEKIVVYNIFSYRGIDSDGLYYKPDGNPEGIHEPCNKNLGVGNNMCDGFCNYTFNIG